MNKAVIAALFGAVTLAGCSQADIASRNISKAADRFEISRRIVFYNGRTDSYMLTIEGLCSLGNQDKDREVTVTCKTGPDSFKKHFLGLSDSITYFVEQTEQAKVDTYHYRVIFRPQTIIPSIGLDTK
jgi:hypothetical protein